MSTQLNDINNKSMSTEINHNNNKFTIATKTKKKERAEELLTDELLFSTSYDLLTKENESVCHSKIKTDIPYSVLTWNIDGLRPRVLKHADLLDDFGKQVSNQRPSVIFIQECHLRYADERDRSVCHPDLISHLETFCKCLPDYTLVGMSLTAKMAAGQLAFVRHGIQHPDVRYNFKVDDPTHSDGGRVILLEFPDIVMLSTYTPATSKLTQESIIRRKEFDQLVKQFVVGHSKISHKPLMFASDFNAVTSVEDISCTQSKLNSYMDDTFHTPPDPLDYGFPGTSQNQTDRFNDMVKSADLYDAGDYAKKRRFTYRAAPNSKWRGIGLRLDKILCSGMLYDSDSISKHEILGWGQERNKFFGSDHCPVFLELKPDWRSRLKLHNSKGMVAKPRTPQYIVKAMHKHSPLKKPKLINSKPGFCQLMCMMTLCSMMANIEPDVVIMPRKDQFKSTHADFDIVLETGVTLPGEALLDSGCFDANYMSGNYYSRHRDVLKPFLRNCHMVTYFGDKKSSQTITKYLELPLAFESDNFGKQIPKQCRFYILEGDGCDLIVGTPDLFTTFGDFFLSKVKDAVTRFTTPTVLSHLDTTGEPICEVREIDSDKKFFRDPPDGTFYPWSTDVSQECDEDKLIPEASSFNPTVLNFLTQSYDDEVDKFTQVLETNCSDNEFLTKSNGETKKLLEQYMHTFVKKEWKGVDVEPVQFDFDPELPDRLKPYTKSIPQQLLAPTRKEFDRLLTYFLEPSNSPWASPLTVAPKATEPFIRLCINLSRINKYIRYGHHPIPNVLKEIQLLKGYSMFLDLDARNGYHQIPLHPATAEKLAVQSPFGLYQPKFLVEGVCCGTAVFQKTMMDIFDDLNPAPGDGAKWLFVLHDNFLIGAHDHADAMIKLRKFLERASEKNVYLKMEKTHLGQTKQHFFGYDIERDHFQMSPDRAEALEKVPFPGSLDLTTAQKVTAMKSFLGQSRIFQPHVPDYTFYSTKLDRMTAKDFNWDPVTWSDNYQKIFTDFKLHLKHNMALFYPDHELDWVLRTDASNAGYGGVLYQILITPEGKKTYQPLKFMSKKWTDPATRWDTFTQECYGIFACVKECEYLLRGKPFIIETDHANLQWLEQSMVPKIIRQHLYIRSYTTWVKHVKGKLNTADYWSRLMATDGGALATLHVCHNPDLSHFPAKEEGEERAEMYDIDDGIPWEDNIWLANLIKNLHDYHSAVPSGEHHTNEGQEIDISHEAMLESVHGGSMMHQGIRRTWLLLNKVYPGHSVSIREVEEFVENCAVCQKCRYGLRDTLTPEVRALKPTDNRHLLGVDVVPVTPHSKDGYTAIITMVNQFTHFVYLYPVKEANSRSMCQAIMAYISNFGLVDQIISDPGTENLNQAVKDLNAWLGIRHVVSLTDVHTSCGVENTNRQIIDHLTALTSDLRLKDQWSDPILIALVQFHFNSSLSRESGVEPFKATFGTGDDIYLHLNPKTASKDSKIQYIKDLDMKLKTLRDASAKFQDDILMKRLKKNVKLNRFQPGDLILKTVKTPTKHWKEQKLGPKFTGPWKILKVRKNDYVCEHVVSHEESEFHVSMIKPYFGTLEMAKRVALLDRDQHVVTAVTAYTGDPFERTTCDFYVHYANGDDLWIGWSRDLAACEAFQLFCESMPELRQLMMKAAEAKAHARQLAREPITSLSIGDKIYVDLRALGATWYNKVLPNSDLDFNMFECIVDGFEPARGRQPPKVRLKCATLEIFLTWDNLMVTTWGQHFELRPNQTLVTVQFLLEHAPLVDTLKMAREEYSRKYHPRRRRR